MNGLYKRLSSKSIGIGGWKCVCCAPGNKKTAKRMKRQERRILERFLKSKDY